MERSYCVNTATGHNELTYPSSKNYLPNKHVVTHIQPKHTHILYNEKKNCSSLIVFLL